VGKAVYAPASDLGKEYRVQVLGQITTDKMELLRYGLTLDGRQLKQAQVNLSGKQTLSFVLKEGRNRQIRRMCELVGLEVVDLLRTRVGPITLGALPEGRWRPLAPEERAALIG